MAEWAGGGGGGGGKGRGVKSTNTNIHMMPYIATLQGWHNAGNGKASLLWHHYGNEVDVE